MPDKILVVDDEVEIADLIEVYLNNENYSVFKVCMTAKIHRGILFSLMTAM